MVSIGIVSWHYNSVAQASGTNFWAYNHGFLCICSLNGGTGGGKVVAIGSWVMGSKEGDKLWGVELELGNLVPFIHNLVEGNGEGRQLGSVSCGKGFYNFAV